MHNKLCFMVCKEFEQEVSTIVESGEFEQIELEVVTFPGGYTEPETDWDSLSKFIQAYAADNKRQQIHLLGVPPVTSIGEPPTEITDLCHIHNKIDQYFSMSAVNQNNANQYLRLFLEKILLKWELENEKLEITIMLAQTKAAIAQTEMLYEGSSQITEKALAQTEALYAGSSKIAYATNSHDILMALVESTDMQKFDRANILLFDKIWNDVQKPSEMIVDAVWEQSGQLSHAPPGSHYKLEQIPLVFLIDKNRYSFIRNIETDERMDKNTRDILIRLGMKAIAIFPLVTGEQWIGVFTVQAGHTVELAEEQIRQISGLTGQAATVIENRHLLEQTRLLAEREHMVNIISQKIQATSTVESALQTAIQELGQLFQARYTQVELTAGVRKQEL